MVVMMDIEISCKGHCEKLSHFLDHVRHTVVKNRIISCCVEENVSFPFSENIETNTKVCPCQIYGLYMKRLSLYPLHHSGQYNCW